MSSLGSEGARFGGHLFLALLSVGAFPVAFAEQRVYFVTEALARSEPNAVSDAMHGWKGPHGRGDAQYGWSWLETGVRGEHWGIGAVCRWDYDLRFSPDLADLYGAVKNDESLKVGRTYDADLKAHIIHAKGIRVSWRDQLPSDLQVEAGLSLLQGTYLMEGSLHGTARATAAKDYDYSAWVDYAYTEDVLFERKVNPAHGYGFALDAQADWRCRPDWQIRVQLRDLAGCLWWKHLPYTRATACSDQSGETDDEGFKHWNPIVSGREGNHRNYRQTLPIRGNLELLYTGASVTPALGLNYQFGDWLPRVGLGRAQGAWSLFAWYWTVDRAIGLEVARKGWKLGLTSDALRLDRARMINVHLGYSY